MYCFIQVFMVKTFGNSFLFFLCSPSLYILIAEGRIQSLTHARKALWSVESQWLHSKQDKSASPCLPSRFPHPPAWEPLFYMQFPWTQLFQSPCEDRRPLSFCAWLMSLSRVSSRFVSVTPFKISFLFLIENSFFFIQYSLITLSFCDITHYKSCNGSIMHVRHVSFFVQLLIDSWFCNLLGRTSVWSTLVHNGCWCSTKFKVLPLAHAPSLWCHP